MYIITTKNFDKKFKKLDTKIKLEFKKKISWFMDNPYDIRLNNHKLNGSLNNYRSINITADYRLIYEIIEEDSFLLISLNTHAELYG